MEEAGGKARPAQGEDSISLFIRLLFLHAVPGDCGGITGSDTATALCHCMPSGASLLLHHPQGHFLVRPPPGQGPALARDWSSGRGACAVGATLCGVCPRQRPRGPRGLLPEASGIWTQRICTWHLHPANTYPEATDACPRQKASRTCIGPGECVSRIKR